MWTMFSKCTEVLKEWINCWSLSFQEYGCTGAAHADSEYERRMMAVYSRVLEEVESLNRKYAPVSYMASGIVKFL